MRNERGFTLIELLIVIAIIGIIAGIAVAQLRTAPQKAREAVLKEDLYAIRDVIDQYFADKGKYPESTPRRPTRTRTPPAASST